MRQHSKAKLLFGENEGKQPTVTMAAAASTTSDTDLRNPHIGKVKKWHRESLNPLSVKALPSLHKKFIAGRIWTSMVAADATTPKACFSGLATELQLKIWKLSLPEPRIIPVKSSKRRSSLVSNLKAPAILHACARSRGVALRFYKLAMKKDSEKSTPGTNFYIDPEVDTIWMADTSITDLYSYTMHNYLQNSIHPIRRLALNVGVCVYDNGLRAFGFHCHIPSDYPALLDLAELTLTVCRDKIKSTSTSFAKPNLANNMGQLANRHPVQDITKVFSEMALAGQSINFEDAFDFAGGQSREHWISKLEAEVKLVFRETAETFQVRPLDGKIYQGPSVQVMTLVHTKKRFTQYKAYLINRLI